MKKILFALDDNHFSQNAFEFVRQLNENEPVLVTGIYIPAFVNDLAWTTPTGDDALFVPRLLAEDETMIRGNIQDFKEACEKSHIECRVHGDVGYSIVEGVQKETRFADLFVIGFESYYKYSGEEYVHDELRQIVQTSECPVLLVPEQATFPDNVVVAYDGSASSVYAMKMFSYVLPSFTSMKTLVAHADIHATSLPDEDYVKELAARHFEDLTFSVLEFEPRKYFITWLEDRPNTMLVTGSYGRSELSQLFRKSFIAELLKNHHIPVFITHK